MRIIQSLRHGKLRRVLSEAYHWVRAPSTVSEEQPRPVIAGVLPVVEPPQAMSCMMCHSMYIKANGEMPCWCHVGEKYFLDELNAQKLADPHFDLANHQRLQQIRYAFDIERKLPWDICSKCSLLQKGVAPPRGIQRNVIDVLHVEASYLCNLDCPLCIPRAERKKLNRPPYHLELPLWESIIANFQKHGVTVKTLHLEGRGEPLMHPDLPGFLKVFRDAFPDGWIQVTTNGNFPWRDEYFLSGMNDLRVSIDGVRAESYAQYRRGGTAERALKFLRDAANARSKAPGKTRIEWKYILFEWNDSDEEMQQAYDLARQWGVELTFCITPWAGKSLRYDYDSLQVKLNEMMPDAKNHPVPTCSA